jgi:hypothetical protein
MTMTHTPAPAGQAVPHSLDRDPMYDVRVWELIEREHAIYELGFHTGWIARQPEILYLVVPARVVQFHRY